MRLTAVLLSLFVYLSVAPTLSWSQVSGNIGFSQSGVKARAEQTERSKRVLTDQELPPADNSMFVDANVLINVKADAFVAVFGIGQEGLTVAESTQKMDVAVRQLTAAVRALNIADDDIFVDFVAQPKIYGFELSGDIARERIEGFELKKTVSIRFRDHAMLDRLVLAAAQVQVYDLIKVDYIVSDITVVQQRLMEEAAAIIKGKAGRYETLLGIRVQPPAQIYAERHAIHYPPEMYDSYVAAESEGVSRPNPQRYTVQQARKGRTFFYNGLDGDGFDKVINPVILEPVVQLTLYLKLKYKVRS
jgi:uncharacterized protein YggE